MPNKGAIGPLGLGTYRVYAFDRGGQDQLGEIPSIAALQWGRRRDDISEATLTTTGFDAEGRDFLKGLRSRRHELVIFRMESGGEAVRVWEGPITRIEDNGLGVVIDAKDVMAYVKRRVLRDGYDDSYPNTKSVVTRAKLILQTDLGREDPNVLPYVMTIEAPDDARESRIVLPYQKTSWEEIDDLAANSGLDYTVLGRSIILWDTHNPIARLDRMTNEDFMARPVITEYGEDLATFAAATNGNGLAGTVGATDPYYGLVEVLATAYSESDTAVDPLGLVKDATDAYEAAVAFRVQSGLNLNANPTDAALISTYQTALENEEDAYQNMLDVQVEAAEEIVRITATLTSQAQRNLNAKNPAPLEVRVPDNTGLSADCVLGINQLVPGAWIPLLAKGTIRDVEQWQKLDSLSVSWADGSELIAVTMSPAPGYGQDTDAEIAAAEEAAKNGG